MWVLAYLSVMFIPLLEFTVKIMNSRLSTNNSIIYIPLCLSAAKSGDDNRDLKDDTHSQKLQRDDIASLKDQGVTGEVGIWF